MGTCKSSSYQKKESIEQDGDTMHILVPDKQLIEHDGGMYTILVPDKHSIEQ